MRSLLYLLLSSVFISAALPTVTSAAFANAGEGTELVMMEEDGCSWCARWMEEIGGFYHNTSEGRIAPLRRVDVHSPIPHDLSFLKPAYFTPTFILISRGREIGRIQGYPGEDFFWALLAELVAKIAPSGPGETQAAR